ncbi:MAG: amidase [Rhodospirillales bacterium]|tara:strand:+ start:13605 stop:14801 length:1197 start_codon:yes stop_codon:yes gene_type:complete
MNRLNSEIDDPVNCFVPHSPPVIKSAGNGSLSGLTFSVKDLYDIKGYKTGNGNPAWLATHNIATNTADLVEACLNAGADMVGKVICDEFFYSFIGENAHYGTPTNSKAPDRIPGGSSSGSAASVAAEICDFSLGSDTGGSVRIPAAFCGIYGLRPTFGRLSLEGGTAMSSSFDTAGWFAKDIDIFAKVGSKLLDNNISPSNIRSIKLAQFAFNIVDDEISIPLNQWLNSSLCNFDFADHVTTLPEGILLDDAREAFRIIQANEIWSIFGSWIEDTDPDFGPGVKERMNIAKTVSKKERETQLIYKTRVSDALKLLVPTGTIMALPVTASLPVKLNTDPQRLNDYRAKTLNIICLASLAGLPQISIPVTHSNGIPVSLGFIGWEGGDEALIEFAKSIKI